MSNQNKTKQVKGVEKIIDAIMTDIAYDPLLGRVAIGQDAYKRALRVYLSLLHSSNEAKIKEVENLENLILPGDIDWQIEEYVNKSDVINLLKK